MAEVFICWSDILRLVLAAVFVGCAVYVGVTAKQSRDAYKAHLAAVRDVQREERALDLLAKIKAGW